jgi:hypothetical protein
MGWKAVREDLAKAKQDPVARYLEIGHGTTWVRAACIFVGLVYKSL